MSEPKHGAAGSLKGSAAILAAIGGVIRGTSGRLEPGRGALLRLWRTPPVVAALVVLFLAAGVMGSFAPGVQAQEPEECDHVWCGSATVKAGAGDADGVGYKPGADYPGSTLDATTFTYKDVSYTVGGIVNDPDDGEVTLLLSPLPDADTVLPLTFRVGDTVLPFGEGTRSETDGAYSWTDSTEFGAEASPFTDDAAIEFAIAKDALPGAPSAHLALASLGDENGCVLDRSPPRGSSEHRRLPGRGLRRRRRNLERALPERAVDPFPPQRPAGRNHLRLPRVGRQLDRSRGAVGRRQRSTGPGNPPKRPTGLSATGRRQRHHAELDVRRSVKAALR